MILGLRDFRYLGSRSSCEQGHLEPSSAAAGSSPAPDSSLAVQEDAGITGAAASLEVPSSTQIGGSGGSEAVSRHVAQGGAVGGGHVSSAGPPGVDALAGNFKNGGPDGVGRMGPPDFRSILQGDDRPAAGAPADMATPSVTPAVGTVMGGSDLVNGSPFTGGQVQPANAGMGTANAQNIPMPEIGLAQKTSNPISDTAISPEPAPANFGGGGLGGGRRMRPPDFRSILQGDDGPAGGTSANMAMPSVTPAVGTVMGGSDLVSGSPFAGGQVQPANAGMGSANAQNIPMPEIGLAQKTSNPISDTANAPEPAPAANFGGGGLGGGRRMRPPDFRSILQGDDGPAGGTSANMAIPSVTPAVGTVMGGSDLVNGSPFAGGQVQPANAGMGSANAQNIPMPEIGLAQKTSNPISDTANAPEPTPANFGGGGLGGGRRMRPPDFRSILQGDDGPAGGTSANMAMPSVTPAVGTVMGGSDLVNGSPFTGGQVQPANAGMGSANAQNIAVPEIGLAPKTSNPISAISPEPAPAANFGGGGLGGGRRMRPPDFRSILQGDDGPAGGTSANMAMPSVTPAVGTAMGGSDLVNGSPFAPTSAAMGSRLGGPIGTAGADSNLSRPGPTSGFDGGGQMRPPDFRNILQGDDLPAPSGLGQGLPASNGAFANGGLPDSPGIAHASAADIQTTAMAELQAPQLSGDPKPVESRDPFGLEDLSGGYARS